MGRLGSNDRKVKTFTRPVPGETILVTLDAVKLIECVPNFSDGRDRAVIDAITAQIEAVDGVMLLDVDPGEATNRTVVTFVGEPGPVEEAAFAAIAKAGELIDMTTHTGEHPRMGATDVCPFVPMEGATMEDCVEIARRLGERVGTELDIPVYLYEHAARDGRRSLADVRRGEYEGLADREDGPDFGPSFIAHRFRDELKRLQIAATGVSAFSQVRIGYRMPTQLGLLERFHGTLKAEEVYWNRYDDPRDARQKLAIFRERYNEARPHWALVAADPTTTPARVLMPHEVYVKDCKVNPPPWSRWVGRLGKDQKTEARPPNRTGLKVSA